MSRLLKELLLIATVLMNMVAIYLIVDLMYKALIPEVLMRSQVIIAIVTSMTISVAISYLNWLVVDLLY